MRQGRIPGSRHVKNLAAIAATAIVLLILLASSVPLMHWFVSEGREASFSDGFRAWTDLAITDYDMTIHKACECPPPAGIPIHVVVRDGRVVQAKIAEGPGAGDPVELRDIPGTIPMLFDTVRAAIDDDPDTLEISYDADYGFPRQIRIDRRKAYSDDETRYAVISFRPAGDSGRL